jgi:hypothetical protein
VDGQWVGIWEADSDPVVDDLIVVHGTTYRVLQVLPNESKVPVDWWAMVTQPTVVVTREPAA